MTEAELEIEVVDLCEQLGLLWHHCTDARRCRGGRGFPDMVIVGRGGHIFRELKGEDGETSAEQDRWGYALRQINHDPAVVWDEWNPDDWRDGTIKRELVKLA